MWLFFSSILDPIFIDFGRLSSWNCPTDSDSIQNVNEVEQGERNYGTVKTSPATKAPYKDMANRRPNTESSSTSLTDKAEVDDLDSEPSINLRRKFKGMKFNFLVFMVKCDDFPLQIEKNFINAIFLIYGF